MTATASAFTSTISPTQPRRNEPAAAATPRVGGQCPNLLQVGAPLPRRTAVPQHRRHQRLGELLTWVIMYVVPQIRALPVGARAQPFRRDSGYRALPLQRLCVSAVQPQYLLIVSAPRSCCPQEDSTPARPSLLPRRRSRNPARAGIHCPSSAVRGRRDDARTTCHSPIGFAGENAVRAQLPDASWAFPRRRATH